MCVHVAINSDQSDTMQLNWQKVDGQLAKVSVGGGNVWGLNAAGDIWRFNGLGWDKIDGKATHISAAADGSVFCVNEADNIWRWTGFGWEPVPGALSCISVGSAQHIWGCNRAGEIYYWAGSGWNKVDGACKQLSVGEDGTVWCVTATGEIYWRAGAFGQWMKAEGQLAVVSCLNAQSVIGVNAAGEIWAWNGQGWVQVNGSCSHISSGGHGNSRVWCCNAAGEIYRVN